MLEEPNVLELALKPTSSVRSEKHDYSSTAAHSDHDTLDHDTSDHDTHSAKQLPHAFDLAFESFDLAFQSFRVIRPTLAKQIKKNKKKKHKHTQSSVFFRQRSRHTCCEIGTTLVVKSAHYGNPRLPPTRRNVAALCGAAHPDMPRANV